jgi:hypothetical protein
MVPAHFINNCYIMTGKWLSSRLRSTDTGICKKFHNLTDQQKARKKIAEAFQKYEQQ